MLNRNQAKVNLFMEANGNKRKASGLIPNAIFSNKKKPPVWEYVPYAGINQIRFEGSASSGCFLSRHYRLPYKFSSWSYQRKIQLSADCGYVIPFSIF